MTNEDMGDFIPSDDLFDMDDDDDDSITITIGKKKKKKNAPLPKMPEPEKEKSGYSFGSKKAYKKAIKGEKARQQAIAKARKKYQPREDKLQAEREKTEKITSGEYTYGFCDKHPLLCKAVGKGKKESIPVPMIPAEKTADAETSEMDRAVRQPLREKKEQERQDRIKNGTDTYCDRHPKICKAGKIVGGTALVGAAVGAAAVDPVAAGMGLGMSMAPRKRAASKTTVKRGTAATRSRTTAPRTKTAPKRTTSTTTRAKPSQNARKPTQKRTTTTKARKSTPKKKSPPKSDWWGYGDAGL